MFFLGKTKIMHYFKIDKDTYFGGKGASGTYQRINSLFNLSALCQRCHLNHDRLYNIQRRRKNIRPNQLELF